MQGGTISCGMTRHHSLQAAITHTSENNMTSNFLISLDLEEGRDKTK